MDFWMFLRRRRNFFACGALRSLPFSSSFLKRPKIMFSYHFPSKAKVNTPKNFPPAAEIYIILLYMLVGFSKFSKFFKIYIYAEVYICWSATVDVIDAPLTLTTRRNTRRFQFQLLKNRNHGQHQSSHPCQKSYRFPSSPTRWPGSET